MIQCSNNSESSIATSPVTRTWIALEQPGPWGHYALDQNGSRLPELIRQHLTSFDARSILIRSAFRRPHHRNSKSRVLYVAPLMDHPNKVFELILDDIHDLLQLSLEDLVKGKYGTPNDSTIHFICTNGKRDICCAKNGRTLLDKLNDRGEIAWESTHLGGHRFAPVHLTLPDGRMWARGGELRGSSFLTPPEQRLEFELYRKGIDISRFTFRSEQVSSNSWHVIANGEKQTYEGIFDFVLEERIESCGKSQVDGITWKI